MILILDVSKKDWHKLLIKKGEDVISKEFANKRNRELLFSIDGFLRENDISKNDLKAVAVVVGQGSFTSTRIACIIANCFAYSLNIKAVAIEQNDLLDLGQIDRKIKNKDKHEYISALYSAEPNIG